MIRLQSLETILITHYNIFNSIQLVVAVTSCRERLASETPKPSIPGHGTLIEAAMCCIYVNIHIKHTNEIVICVYLQLKSKQLKQNRVLRYVIFVKFLRDRVFARDYFGQ